MGLREIEKIASEWDSMLGHEEMEHTWRFLLDYEGEDRSHWFGVTTQLALEMHANFTMREILPNRSFPSQLNWLVFERPDVFSKPRQDMASSYLSLSDLSISDVTSLKIRFIFHKE